MAKGLALLLLAALAACGTDKKGEESGEPAAPAAGQPVAPADAGAAAGAAASGGESAAVAYPDSLEGLQKLAADLLAALERGEENRVTALLESLRLPGYEAWFRDRFGDEAGAGLAEEYRPHHDDIGLLAPVLAEVIARKQRQIEVGRFESAADGGAVLYQAAALAAMKKPAPLYSIRFADAAGRELFHLWSFVHERGTFRYVGKMKRAAGGEPPAPGVLDPRELRKKDAARVEEAQRSAAN